MTDTQLCMNCGERPAEAAAATVPLCSTCQNLAKGKERGVKMTPKATSPKDRGKRPATSN